MGTTASVLPEDERLKTVSVSGIKEKINQQRDMVAKINEIRVGYNGFSQSKLAICAGQAVTFIWDNTNEVTENSLENVSLLENNKIESENKFSFSIIQVIEDDVEGKYRPVIGGYNSGKPSIRGSVTFYFKLNGEYKFKIKNLPREITPCVIYVTEEQPVNAQITDEGFQPKFIKIDEGRSIKWDWSYCIQPHSIYEAEYCENHNGLYRTSKELVVPACSNTYKRSFSESGIYYFQTESRNAQKKHICVVQVVESFKEYKIDVFDSKFSPMLLTIEEGDKVWFSWNKDKSLKRHAVYEIIPPMPDHPNDQPYIEKKDGFKWTVPSRTGLLCHRFDNCGVYYYSDILENECASYIGVIVVKPKSANYEINIKENALETDIRPIEAGDRVWWKWDPNLAVTISFLDSNLLYDKKLDTNKCKLYGECEEIEQNSFSKFGIFSTKVTKPGVHYFKVNIEKDEIVSTVVASPPPKDHKVEVTDAGFAPSIINVNPEDRVWFVWTDSKKSHNIRQVTHQNQIIKDGFLSGSLIEPPSVFMHSFSEQGIFYFRSDGLKNCLGAVVVVPEPTIQVIHVNDEGISPDPLVASVYDTVIWVYPSVQTNDLVEITNQNDLLIYPIKSQEILARKCISRSFKEPNVYHFASPSFNRVLRKEEMDSKGYKNIVLSSVIVDKKYEYILVTLDKDGFHPDLINIAKNKSILFDWKESNESHNIMHIKKPFNQNKIELVEGNRAFNSKHKTLNDNFLYTFEEEGEYYIISEGAPGHMCLVNVLDNVLKTATPKLINREPSIINKYHKIHLHCDTPGATIYYTTNGTQPNRNSPSLKLYEPDNGILLTEIGFCFIRAVAISDGCVMSDIFTSQRFFVIDSYNNREDMYVIPETEQTLSNGDWWRAIPRITINYLGDGCIEVIWNKPPNSSLELISHYQLFLNRVSYKSRIRLDANKLMIRGLCGGRTYEISLMVFPKKQTYLPQQSNILNFQCPRMTENGGPIISLKANSKSNQATIVWSSIDTEACPIDFYQLFINDEKKEIIKSGNSHNKVIVDGFEPGLTYSMKVIAVSKSALIPFVSNEILLKLPLDMNQISLPDPALRENNKDLYDEYIQIEDGEFKQLPKAQTNYAVIKKDYQKSQPKNMNIDINALQENLPIPRVSASHHKPGKLLIEWVFTRLPEPHIKLNSYIVSLIGTEFGNLMKSDASYDCFMEINNIKLPAIQHCWNTGHADNLIIVDGIIDTSIYQIFVTAVFCYDNNGYLTEFRKSSPIINYISLGPPYPPKLRVINIDLQSATLEWSINDYPKPDYISGYRLKVDGEYKEKFSTNQHEFVFNELKPGKSYKLELIALTNSIIGQSEPSKPVTVICPKKPKPPLIYQSSTLKINSVVISWKPSIPRSINKEDQIWMYKIYLNNVFHGEIFSSNLSTYSYMISDLIPGQFYDVSIKALCGQRIQLPSDDDTIFCLVSSDSSNILPVTPTSPPLSPPLKLESIHPDGIDITWTTPQQFGEALLSGYQLIINGKPQEEILSADLTRTIISDVTVGETYNLQIMALTNHPCGQYSVNEDHPNYNVEYAMFTDSSSTDNREIYSIIKNKRYSACKPGPSLVVKYSNLVLPAIKIQIEKLTGYSVLITWELDQTQSIHYVKPEYYSISYKCKGDVTKSLTTKSEYINLNELKPSSYYTIIIESRKESKRLTDLVNGNEQLEYTCLYYSKSKPLNFVTASPPGAPSNLSLVTSTCHGIRICWDQPVDNGSDLIATRVYCYPIDVDQPKTFIKEFTPDITNCIIENLNEKTKYRVTVTAITGEYLAQHNIKEIKKLPTNSLEGLPWLPSANIDVVTSGTEPPTNLELKLTYDNKPNIFWKQAKTYGTNILVSQILFYRDLELADALANQIMLPPNAISCLINNVKIGAKYKIWIEAVVSIKLTYEADNEKNDTFLHYNELKDRRITHVISEPIIIRVPAPCERPVIFLTGYSTRTIDLFWTKPLMYSEHAKLDDPCSNYIINRHLLGYRIEVNGINQKELNNTENICTLTNCKPSNIYNIVLIARTCLKDSLIKTKNLSDLEDIDIDESKSFALQLRLPSEKEVEDLKFVRAKYEEVVDDSSNGRILLAWDVHDMRSISQFNINWFIPEEATSHRKSLDSNSTSCIIPLNKKKCFVEINLETLYKNSKSFISEKLCIEVPGSPDPPKLWIREKLDHNIILNWSEPRIHYMVPCGGYQLYLNDAKIGDIIDPESYQATVSLKPNRNYKIAIQTLSSRNEYNHSKLSNILSINTYVENFKSTNNDIQKVFAEDTFQKARNYLENIDKELISIKEFYNQQNLNEADECNLPLKINKIGEDYVDLDWRNVVIENKFDTFKIEYHCWNTDKRNVEFVNNNITKFTIKSCRPGSIYSIRVSAIQGMNNVVNKSKYILLQTCAPPDTPALKLRACNFKYITIEWNKPRSYGDASIVGYKIYIDKKATAVVAAEQTTFSLSNGVPCHEYSFQIQAITEREDLSSIISEALLVVWPGVKCPNLHLIETRGCSLKVGWNDPKIAGNAKISFYRIICHCEETDRTIIQGPFDSTIAESQIDNIGYGRHKINLEVNLFGVTEPFLSNTLYVELGLKPDPPALIVSVPALDERIKLDNITSKLINKRDRILKIITNNGISKQQKEITKSHVDKVMLTLNQLEEALDDCLNLMNLFTGSFVVNLSWHCAATQFSKIAGYKIYLNDKPYGTDLPESISNIRLKLSLDKVLHKISVTSFSLNPFIESETSNVIEISTERFLQFSFYCYNQIHIKNSLWPKYGCCAFQDSIIYERLNLAKTRENTNIGLYVLPQPFPVCQVFDLVSGKPVSIISNNTMKTNKIHIILFWAKWCLPSMRILQYLVGFARKNITQYEFIACHHGSESVDEMRDLLKKTGFNDSNVHFYSDSNEILKIHSIKDLSPIDIYDIKGLPTLIMLNKNLQLVWKGRYCSYEYMYFECFMHHTISEIMDIKCPVLNCEICANDIEIEKELHEIRNQQKHMLKYKDMIIKPLTNKQSPIYTSGNLSRNKQLITIKDRPYTISKTGFETLLKAHSSPKFFYNSSQLNHSSDDSSGFCYYRKYNTETS